MEKIWIILINGKEEGPYSVRDLKLHPSFDPDVLVKKVGSFRWVAARYVAELKEVFEDEGPCDDDSEAPYEEVTPTDEMVIDYRQDPPQTFLWMVIAAVLLYILYRFFDLN